MSYRRFRFVLDGGTFKIYNMKISKHKVWNKNISFESRRHTPCVMTCFLDIFYWWWYCPRGTAPVFYLSILSVSNEFRSRFCVNWEPWNTQTIRSFKSDCFKNTYLHTHGYSKSHLKFRIHPLNWFLLSTFYIIDSIK